MNTINRMIISQTVNPVTLLIRKDTINNAIIIIIPNKLTPEVSFPNILFMTIKIKIHAAKDHSRNSVFWVSTYIN